MHETQYEDHHESGPRGGFHYLRHAVEILLFLFVVVVSFALQRILSSVFDPNFVQSSMPGRGMGGQISHFLLNGFSIPSILAHLVIGAAAGRFLRTRARILGIISLIIPLYLTGFTCYEVSANLGSHNLLPFEIVCHYILPIPLLIGLAVGYGLRRWKLQSAKPIA